MLLGYGDAHPLSQHAVITFDQLVREASRVLGADQDNIVLVGGFLTLASSESGLTAVSMLKVLATIFFLLH
jgi:hypothetical protein